MAKKKKNKKIDRDDKLLLLITILYQIFIFPLGINIIDSVFGRTLISLIPAFILLAVLVWIVTVQAFRKKYNSKIISLICGLLVLTNLFLIIYIGEHISDGHLRLFGKVLTTFRYNAPFLIMFGLIYAIGSSKKVKQTNLSKIVLIIVGTFLYYVFLVLCNMFTHWATEEYKIDFFEGWKKPIIYIYPEKDMNVEVTLSNPEKLTVTYPKYEDSWKVKALTDGTLIDSNNKMYYALYWEGVEDKDTINKDGFVIKGEDSASFLEEKLEILGLNYKERNEFIMYWLPKLEKNKYNYIRFKTREEIDNNMKLDINPEPDTLIRVMMEYKGLDKKIKVKEEKLTQVERDGYSVVEWGGTEIK